MGPRRPDQKKKKKERKGLPLLSCIFIWTFTFCFAATKFSSATSVYLYVSTNEMGIKSEISGVMWQVAPESKFQLFSCKLSPKYLLGLYPLEEIFYIDAYIFCELFWSVILSEVLSIFADLYAQVLGFYVLQWNLFPKVSGFGKFTMKWPYNPNMKHLFGFKLLCSVHLLLELHEFMGDLLLP